MALDFLLVFIHFGIQSTECFILLAAARHFLLYVILIKTVYTKFGVSHFQ